MIRVKRIMITLAGVLVVIALGFLGHYFLTKSDDCTLSVYAEQQDAYVQLVLDQINLQKDRSDEEIINGILSSLDGSGQKYWTLSKEKELLFVKDVTETNRYKGVTTATFYASESASGFLDRLAENRVIHEFITLDDEKYVASGVLFSYQEQQYRICLLTNESFVLDNNEYLSSKISNYIFLGILLVLMVLLVMIGITVVSKRNETIADLQERLEVKNQKIDELEETMKSFQYYHTRWSVFNSDLMPVFKKKLQEKKVQNVQVAKLSFATSVAKKKYLELAQVMLDERVIRFSDGSQHVTLMFVGYTKEEVNKALEIMDHVLKNGAKSK